MNHVITHRPSVTVAELAPARRWVAWRTELRGGRPTKVPIRPSDGLPARSTAPADWACRAEAERRAAMLPDGGGPKGVGVVLGAWPGHDALRLAGVDLDACRDPVTGALADWAIPVIEVLATYAEVSPSKTGVKLFFQIAPDAIEALREAGLLSPEQFGRSLKRAGEADHPPAVEMFLSHRFFTLTGDRLPDSAEHLRLVPTETLATLLREIGPRFKNAAPPAAAPFGIPDLGRGGGDGSRSARAFGIAARVKACGGDYADFLAACEADPAAGAWLREKGLANGGREARRAWERAGDAAPAEPAAWPEPDLSLARAEAIPPPAWPADLFPAWWRDFFADAAEARGCPPDYVGLAVLAAVASRLGNARWGSPWEGWAEPPVLWCAAVGLPSSGKSSGLDEAAAALSTLEAVANEDWEARQREYRTRKQEADEVREKWKAEVKAAVKNGAAPPLQPEAAREPDPPAKRRAVTSDPTIEKAGQMAAQTPRGLLLLRDELSGWLGGMGRYSGAADGDRAFWISAHGGRRWMPDRVKDGDAGVVVPHLTFGVVGTIQPDRVASLLMAGDDDGLAARFLYAWPAPRKPTRPTRPPPTGRLAAALRRLEGLPWQPPERGVLPFTEEAAAVLQEWREETAEMAAEASGLFLSWVGKLPGFALRLAVVFQHLDWLARPDGTPPPAAVDADAVVRALGFLADYAVPMARRVFGEAALPEAERDARRLARWWLRQNPPPEVVNARELRRRQNGPGIATAERIEAALSDLAAAGWCRAAPGGGGGRPRKDWVMNPALREVRP